MLRRICVSFLLVVSASAFTQIGFGGRPLSPVTGDAHLLSGTVEFPRVDAARMIAEDASLLASGVKGPLRFGVNHVADLSMDNSGARVLMNDSTSVWRLVLYCPEATSINFVFGEFIIPHGARVFVWNEAGDVLGAFTQASSGGRPSLGVSPLPGDRITIQYEEPADLQGTGLLRITQVTHGYRTSVGERGLGDSGACNNNVICPEGDPWREQIAAVAMIVVNGNGWCTGQLINNCANDGTPYFLTANHCTAGQDPANWIFRFNWESPTCDPTAAGTTANTVSGATLLESDEGSDVALLLLNTAPPASFNPWYTGWDATGDAPGSTTVIHHPSGDVKKISFDDNAPVPGEFGGAECWHILAWDDGSTEGGSSGSGLWNPTGRLIGQLFGGQASCGPPASNNVNDYFGRFDLSYPLLSPWLGTCQPPILDGHDPNAAPLALDVSLLTISGVEPNYCNTGTISPVLTIRNNGISTLTQITITYEIDNDGPNGFDWSGSLLTGMTVTVPLPDLAAASGVHVLNVTCSAPNGGVDGYAPNDQQSRTFHVASPGEPITLTINTDDYGSETTWTIEAAGATLYSGGPYADVSGGEAHTAEFCLEEACFSFTIMDAVGDGICCAYGDGDYTITDSDGDVLLDGSGSFGTSATNTFCTGFAHVQESEEPTFRVFPDPSAGPVTVVFPRMEDTITITVRDMLGRELQRVRATTTHAVTLDLAALPDGRYLMDAMTGHQRTVRVVTIGR